MGTAGARVARGFFRGGVHGLPGEELAQRAATTIAHDLLRRADTGTAPLAECVLHDPVLPRVIGNHRDDARRGQTVTQRRERSSERVEFAVDGDAQRLEEPREIAGAGARPEDGADSADEVVACNEGAVPSTADSLARETAALGFVAELLEDRFE